MKYKIENPRRTIIFFGVVILLITGIIFGIVAWKKHKNNQRPENQPQVFEALVAITDQNSSDPVEDMRANLKAGDVIAYFPEGHSWSDTEKNSYLIVKLKLRPDEAQNLTKPQTKKMSPENIPQKEQGKGKPDSRIEEVTVRARAYRLKIEKINFNVQKFWENHQQPDPDKIYDSGMIEKKKEIK